MPEKERYKINIIPCNSGSLYKKQINKSKSADDMTILDALDKQAPEPLNNSASNSRDISKNSENIGPIQNHLAMIASRARNVERKGKKTKSSGSSPRFHRHQDRIGLIHIRATGKVLGLLQDPCADRRRWLRPGVQSAAQENEPDPSDEE
jgi:hypothetical protein